MYEERPFKEVTIPVPWGKIHGKLWGPEDVQPILFLHGWQDNAGSFDPLVALLPADIPILCIEFPGHGFSSQFPKGQMYYLFWDGLLITRRVVKHFGWKSVSIVGHSLGGAVGFMYAAAFPDEVDKLVSLDIVCPRVSKPSTLVKQMSQSIDTFLKYENLPPEAQPCYAYDEMIQVALFGYKGSVSKEGIEVLMKRGMDKVEGSEKYKFCRDVRLKVAGLAMPSIDIVMEMAAKIKCHYLNIRAKDGLPLESPEIYPMVLEKLETTCASFAYHEVPGTHHVHLNSPELIAPIISEFLST